VNKTFCVKYHAGEIFSLSTFKRQVIGFGSLLAKEFGFRNPVVEILSITIETRTENPLPPGSCKIDTGARSLG
jgi:hypothetical protein